MKKVETYEELIRMKRCVDLTKYYGLEKNDLEKIYLFLEKNSFGIIKGDREKLVLITPDNQNEKIIIDVKSINPKIDGVYLTNDSLLINPRIDD